jgi:hypothetical protein
MDNVRDRLREGITTLVRPVDRLPRIECIGPRIRSIHHIPSLRGRQVLYIFDGLIGTMDIGPVAGPVSDLPLVLIVLDAQLEVGPSLLEHARARRGIIVGL